MRRCPTTTSPAALVRARSAPGHRPSRSRCRTGPSSSTCRHGRSRVWPRRGGAPPAALGRISGDPGSDRVLAGPSQPTARPHPVPPHRRRVESRPTRSIHTAIDERSVACAATATPALDAGSVSRAHGQTGPPSGGNRRRWPSDPAYQASRGQIQSCSPSAWICTPHQIVTSWSRHTCASSIARQRSTSSASRAETVR